MILSVALVVLQKRSSLLIIFKLLKNMIFLYYSIPGVATSKFFYFILSKSKFNFKKDWVLEIGSKLRIICNILVLNLLKNKFKLIITLIIFVIIHFYQ
jgi:hypothetical protein